MIRNASSPQSQNRYTSRSEEWSNTLLGSVSRLCANPQALQAVEPDRVRTSLDRGEWRLTPTEQSENALLALMACDRINWADASGRTGEDTRVHPWAKTHQALALTLEKCGCNPFKSMHKTDGGADCLDLAILHNAHTLAAAWLPRAKDAATRQIKDLPYLHAAALGDHLEVLDVLIAHGLDINTLDGKGNTALFYASSAEGVAKLCRAGIHRSHANLQGLDARSFWVADRQIRGERLPTMTSALGRLPRPAPDQAITQFLAQIKTAPAGKLAAERKRLRIKGDEVATDGSTVASATLARAKAALGQGPSAQRIATENWLSYFQQWDEALIAAKTAELAKLYVIAHALENLPVQDKLLDQLAARGKSVSGISIALASALGSLAQETPEHQEKLQLERMIILGFGMNIPWVDKAPGIIGVCMYGNCSYLRMDTYKEIKKTLDTLDAKDPVWTMEGFAEVLFILSIAPASGSPSNFETHSSSPRRLLREKLLDACYEHDVLGALTVNALCRKYQNQDPTRAGFLEEIANQHERRKLAQATPPTKTAARPSSRL